MHYRSQHHIHYRTNRTFRLGVLVLIPHSVESLSLFLIFATILVLLYSKKYIITMIVKNAW